MQTEPRLTLAQVADRWLNETTGASIKADDLSIDLVDVALDGVVGP